MGNKIILSVFVFIAGVLIISSCCKQSFGTPEPIEDVKVKFDTAQPGGCTKADIDTVLVKYKRMYQDSLYGWKMKYFFDTFYSNKQGGFNYSTYTLSNIPLGLQRNVDDTLTIFAGNKVFQFYNAVLNISHSGRCNEKSTLVKHELQLNGVVFDLENRNQKKGNITVENGVFFVK